MPKKPTLRSLAAELEAAGIRNDWQLARHTDHWVAEEMVGLSYARYSVGLALYQSDPGYHGATWGQTTDPRIVLRVRWQGRGSQHRAATTDFFLGQVAAHLGHATTWERSPWKATTRYPEGTIARALAALGAPAPASQEG